MVDAHVEHEFAPHPVEDVRLLAHVHPGLLEELVDRLQLVPSVEVVLLRQAQKEDARVGVGQAGPLAHGVHSLGHPIDHLFRAEGLAEGLLTGHTVEHREDHSVLPHTGGRQGHGLLQRRALHRENQQLGRLLPAVGDVERTLLPVAEDLRLAVTCQALAVGQEADAVRPQMLDQGVAVEDAQSTHPHDGHRFDHWITFLFSRGAPAGPPRIVRFVF